MKRYLVFAGMLYPNGGWKDFISDHDDFEVAVRMAYTAKEDNSFVWAHVVEPATKNVVCEVWDQKPVD